MIADVAHATDPIQCGLRSLLPLGIGTASAGSDELGLFKCLVSRYHYLGLQNTVGENLKYLIRDCRQRPVACLFFGSAAWKTASRDQYIGWDAGELEANLHLVTSNTRFLILPWVRVPYLASHLLSRISKRIGADWLNRYGHTVELLETFVDRSRFRGMCYRAANWTRVGSTTGRTRNDRTHTIQVSRKDVHVYALNKNFRRALIQI